MYEGAGGYFGYGYEQAPGIPGTITSYLPMQSENFEFKAEKKQNPNMTPRGTKLKGRLTGMTGKGTVKNAPDCESMARMRAHHRGKVDTSTLDAGEGVYQHLLEDLLRSDAEPATYRRTLSGVVYRDDDRPMWMTDGRVQSITIEAKEGDYLTVTHEILWGHRSRVGLPVESAVNAAFTGTLHARGVRRDPASTSGTTNDVYVKVITGGALDGTATIKMKIGSATAYGATVYEVYADRWMVVYDETGLVVGASQINPMEILFHQASGGDVLTADDEWIIPAQQTVAIPTYTERDVYSGGQVIAEIDDVQYEVKNWTIKGTFPRTQVGRVGSIFTKTHDNGQVDWSIDFDRQYNDTDFVDALESGAESHVYFECKGDLIGESGIRDSWWLDFPSVEYDDAGTNNANAGQLQEKVMMSAFDNGSDGICTEGLINTIATL